MGGNGKHCRINALRVGRDAVADRLVVWILILASARDGPQDPRGPVPN